ncbi:MAG: AsmA-like C-terminal region-containing protein [Hyphomicrobiales bacterium]
MPRLLRIGLIAVGGLFGLILLLFLAAFFLIPRDFIEKQARAEAAKIPGMSVTWTRLTPGFRWLAVGIRVEGLAVRAPREGNATLNARIQDVFVELKLLPLLARRVEVATARVRGGGVAMFDRGLPAPSPGAGAGAGGAGGIALVVPRITIDDLDLRTRDMTGSGFDLRGVHGESSIDGPLARPASVRIALGADSLYWKPSVRDSLVPLPSPLSAAATLAARDGGKRLEVTDGSAELGPLDSKIGGSVLFPDPPAAPTLALTLTGAPQMVRSTDPSIRPLASRSPATWSGTASWDVRVEGPMATPVTSGRFVLKQLQVTAQSNTFTIDQASASFTSRPDRTFTARLEGLGSGITFTAEAQGSSAPGTTTSGQFYFRAPAQRLNGLVPNTPTWNSGSLEGSGTFTVTPPAPPKVTWKISGAGMSGNVPGVARPVRKLDFSVDGDQATANLSRCDIVVGSTTGSITGSIRQGKPLGSGTFRVKLDRFVAEEWDTGSSSASGGSFAMSSGTPSAPPIPLESFQGQVTIGELRSNGLVVRDVNVPVDFSKGTLTADPIHGLVGSGTVNGALDVSEFFTDPRFSLHLDLNKAPVEDVINGLLPAKLPVTGLVNGKVDLSGPGLPGPDVVDSLRGDLSGTIEQGAIRANPVIRSIRDALGSDSSPEIAFRTLTQSIRISGGKMLLDTVKGDMGKDAFEMTGSMGFDQSLDLHLLLKLGPERVKGAAALSQLAGYVQDAQGRVPVQVRITGTALSPKISIQPGKLVESAGRALGQELMKGLAAKAAPETAAADSTKQKAIDKGREAIQRLLGK